MSSIAVTASATGAGVITLAAPVTNTNRTITLPDEAGTVVAEQVGNAVYKQSNVLGTVGQSAGVPTGSIIESGINANGGYVKYANGTMICNKTTNFSGQSLVANGPALVMNRTMAGSFVSGADTTYNFSARLFDSGGFECYGYFGTYDEGLLANTGHRPANVHSQWNTVGSSVATNGYYKVLAVGRWF